MYFLVNGEINRNGGVLNGRKLEVVPFDNAMKAEKTTELLRKAIDDGIKFVTQGAGTNHALNIIKQVDKWNSRNPGKEVIYFNHSAVSTILTNELCSYRFLLVVRKIPNLVLVLKSLH